MLPAAHRMRRSVDFERAVRRGTRAGRSTVVVHLAHEPGSQDPPLVGFVVSKAVGNAVRRNLVKRRLRAAMASQLADLPQGARVVVRALPAAATADHPRLARELGQAVDKALTRAGARAG